MISSWNGSRSSVTSEPLMRSVDCVDECYKLKLVWCDEKLEQNYILEDVKYYCHQFMYPLIPLGVKKWGI